MAHKRNILGLLVIVPLLWNSSCRKEEFELEGTRPDMSLTANANAINLLLRTVMNDGSVDNIIDQANCFTVALPVDLVVNNNEITITTPEDYDVIENLFEENDEDEDLLEIVFPISLILNDHSTLMVANEAQLNEIRMECSGENEEDDDIECLDITYPVNISQFNTNTELFNTITIQNDMELHEFITDLDENDVASLEFPIILVLTDGTELEIETLEALENALEEFMASCDEDDDFDFDDDDCDNCSIEALEQVLMSCTDWRVNKFERDGENLKNENDHLSFMFREEGILKVASETETFIGNWTIMGVGNAIMMEIDIPSLPDFNLVWKLNRIIETPGVDSVLLRVDNENVLRFQDVCNDPNDNGNRSQDPKEVLMDGTWQIASFIDGETDNTAIFNTYSLVFNDDGTVVATAEGEMFDGNWVVKNGSTRLALNFGDAEPFDQFNSDWRIYSISEEQIILKEIGAGDRSFTLQMR